MLGVFQKVLNVDLNTGLIGEERLPAEWFRESIGGQGLGILYLLEDFKLKKPILDDPIIIMTGPLTGTPVPAASKAIILSYRKEARLFKIASLQGKFPAYLKLAGFDGLVISGKTSLPKRLCISNKESRLVDASSLWGKDIIATEKEIYEEGRDISTLAIGPAGEQGSPYGSIVADQFVNRGPGIGCDFGVKNLKHISVEADYELEIHARMQDFATLLSEYVKKNAEQIEMGEFRRSCFGCVKCCGIYNPDDCLVFLEADVDKLKGLLPGLSFERRYIYYKECHRLGLDPYTSAWLWENGTFDKDFEKWLARMASDRNAAKNSCVNTGSWEEAQLMVNHWYNDIEFGTVKSIKELVVTENAVMLKNCLPLCEYWSMPHKIAASFLFRVGGVFYSPDELFDIAQRVRHRSLGLYRDLDYRKAAFGNNDVCTRFLPRVLVDQPDRYLELRGLKDTGYPDHEN